jgi:hypothetical protein
MPPALLASVSGQHACVLPLPVHQALFDAGQPCTGVPMRLAGALQVAHSDPLGSGLRMAIAQGRQAASPRRKEI